MTNAVKVQSEETQQKASYAFPFSIAPLAPLVLAMYVLHADIFPRLAPATNRRMEWMIQALILTSGILILANLRLGLRADGAARKALGEPSPSDRPHEIGNTVQFIGQMLRTIESQTEEISRSANRLDAAYKQLQGANARLEASVNADVTGQDPITGLYTRQFFNIRLDEEVNRYTRFGHPVSVVMVHLDDVRAGGHGEPQSRGEDTLREVADLLLKHSRGINVIARYGGDEFAVLLVETSKLGAQRYAERIRGIIGSAECQGERVTASFGVASLPEDVPASADELLRSAQAALYAAKRRGTNSVATYENTPTGSIPVAERPGA
jgi:diguanylate cyclase (GGDEF)-like protein